MRLKSLKILPKTKGTPQGFYQSKQWKQIREHYIRLNPLCVHCSLENKTVYANVVDHIVPKNQGGSDHSSNLQSLCNHHHQIKSQRERHDYGN